MPSGMSPTSSRNKVPPLACSISPLWARAAPVNAPRVYPKSSASMRPSGKAAQFTATHSPIRSGRLRSCSSRETTSLPTPDSPVIRTGSMLSVRRSIKVSIFRIEGDSPSTGPVSRGGAVATSRLRRCIRASRSKGFVTKSSAPDFSSETASSIVPKPVMKMKGGRSAGSSESKRSLPDMSGRRRSQRTTEYFRRTNDNAALSPVRCQSNPRPSMRKRSDRVSPSRASSSIRQIAVSLLMRFPLRQVGSAESMPAAAAGEPRTACDSTGSTARCSLPAR